MATTSALKRKLLSPPGDTIQETIDAKGMSQFELAERMGKNPKNINQMIKGKEPISQNTAIQLERVLGIPAQFWLEREREYRQVLAQIEAEESLTEHLHWIRQFPIAAMQRFGWIPRSADRIQIVKSFLSFFGIASPRQWEEIYLAHSLTVSFRMSLAHTNSPGAMSCWLRRGELQSYESRPGPFEQSKFYAALDKAKELVRTQPNDFKEQLQRLCSRAGVAVVFTPCLPNVTASGAARWTKNGTVALIQLSCRYKTNDHFWFSFFHEAGHIVKHGKKEVFLEEVKGAKIDKQKEKEANVFASEILFPAKGFRKIMQEPMIDERTIGSYDANTRLTPQLSPGGWSMSTLCTPVGSDI
jgi:HTH-type transcriptional regulator/antitoxin HigA